LLTHSNAKARVETRASELEHYQASISRVPDLQQMDKTCGGAN